jgi:hypothetical protein
MISGDAVLERLPQVEIELVAPIERDETGDGDEAAVAGPSPVGATSSKRTVLLISVRCGAMSPQGARMGIFMSDMVSFLFVEPPSSVWGRL